MVTNEDLTLDDCCGLAAEVGDLDTLNEACHINETKDTHYTYSFDDETCTVEYDRQVNYYRLGDEDLEYPIYTDETHLEEWLTQEECCVAFQGEEGFGLDDACDELF